MFMRCSDNICYLSGAIGLHQMEAFDQKSTKCASFVQRGHTIRLRSEVTTDSKTPLFKQLKQREKAVHSRKQFCSSGLGTEALSAPAASTHTFRQALVLLDQIVQITFTHH